VAKKKEVGVEQGNTARETKQIFNGHKRKNHVSIQREKVLEGHQKRTAGAAPAEPNQRVGSTQGQTQGPVSREGLPVEKKNEKQKKKQPA